MDLVSEQLWRRLLVQEFGACIAGSSRPCSGAEHLFSHALEYVVGTTTDYMVSVLVSVLIMIRLNCMILTGKR